MHRNTAHTSEYSPDTLKNTFASDSTQCIVDTARNNYLLTKLLPVYLSDIVMGIQFSVGIEVRKLHTGRI